MYAESIFINKDLNLKEKEEIPVLNDFKILKPLGKGSFGKVLFI